MGAPANDAVGPSQAWDGFRTTFKIADARIAATLKDGGAVVESGLSLIVTEGRGIVWRHHDEDPVCELEYQMTFDLDNDHVPEAGASVEARIVIEGTAENGRRIEIRGNGWLGYNERSDIEGHFYKPPRVIVEDEPGERYPVDPELLDDFVAALDVPEPQPSEQFARAMAGTLNGKPDYRKDEDQDD